MEKEHKQATHRNALAHFFIQRAELGKKLSDELENDPQDNTQFLWICHHLWPTLLALLITWIVVMVVFGGFGPSQLFFFFFIPIFTLIFDKLITSQYSDSLYEEEEEILFKQSQKQLKIQFYKDCEQHGIKEKMDSYSEQKAELIALRLGCVFDDIKQYYKEAKALTLEEEQTRIKNEKEQQFAKLKAEEKETEKQLTEFADYQGRDKRIAMLEDRMQRHLDAAKGKQQLADATFRATQQREMNWGIAGGIASGLAGGAAGIAAAMDVKEKNEQIRAQNKSNLETLEPFYLNTILSASASEKAAERLQSRIDDAEIKVVADIPDKNVINYLAIDTENIQISETGAFTITAKVQLKEKYHNLKIGSSDAVVDGTIAAEMYQSGKCVGRALMVLPESGIQNWSASLKGIALGEADAKLPYKIKYVPYHLWVMEE